MRMRYQPPPSGHGGEPRSSRTFSTMGPTLATAMRIVNSLTPQRFAQCRTSSFSSTLMRALEEAAMCRDACVGREIKLLRPRFPGKVDHQCNDDPDHPPAAGKHGAGRRTVQISGE